MNNTNRSIYNGWAFRLIVINVLVYIIQFFTEQYRITYLFQGTGRPGPSIFTFYMGLTPALVVQKGYVWQIFSYMFLHDTGNFLHLFFNMYALLIFGTPVEHEWGSKKFFLYYLFCGTFAGITIFLMNFIDKGIGYFIPTIGASGAVFGLLLAFGIFFPNVELLLFFIIPIRAKYLVILYAGIEIFLEISGGNSTVSHIGHLGGLAGGILFFLFINRRAIQFKLKKGKALKLKKPAKSKSKTAGPIETADINNTSLQISILKKLKDSGYESLTDDEIQYIKYIEIMTEDFDKSVLCNEVDLDIEDEHCKNCEYFHVCFLREVKKFLEN
jgi:membrane associated rhomboid family serine protease